jgi:hypothetical protein
MQVTAEILSTTDEMRETVEQLFITLRKHSSSEAQLRAEDHALEEGLI